MRRDLIIVAATIVFSVAATVLIYKPITLVVYRLQEPYFSRPLNIGSAQIIVRNDAHGDGGFGSKRRNGRTHSGIDMLAPVGTPVYASKSGIAFKGEVPTGYGKYVMIYHPDGFQTYYGHLSEWAVQSTQYVKRGELIGYVGKTGNAASKSMQSHLHFEIRKNGEPINPKGLMR